MCIEQSCTGHVITVAALRDPVFYSCCYQFVFCHTRIVPYVNLTLRLFNTTIMHIDNTIKLPEEA